MKAIRNILKEIMSAVCVLILIEAIFDVIENKRKGR